MINLSSNKRLITKFIDIIARSFINKVEANDVVLQNKSNGLARAKKVLFIEIWGIGDLVMASSALAAIKNQFPHIEIGLLSKSYALDIFKFSGLVDRYFFYDFPWTRFKKKYLLWSWDWLGLIKLVKNLRREKFDLILDARGDFRNNLLSFLIGSKHSIGYDWSGGGNFLTHVALFDHVDGHRVDAWLNLVKYYNVKVNSPQPSISISAAEKEWAGSFLIKKGIEEKDLLIGIHPGARISTRSWPLGRFAKIADYFIDTYKAKVIVFVDPEGRGGNIPIQGEYIPVKLSLREFIAVLSKLNFFVCNDGGPMHLAAALGIPMVSVFGPTEPKWFGPYGQKDAVVIKDNLTCRPCFDYCSLRKPICLESIDFEQVKQRIKAKLKKID